jgi:hypothetical protein
MLSAGYALSQTILEIGLLFTGKTCGWNSRLSRSSTEFIDCRLRDNDLLASIHEYYHEPISDGFLAFNHGDRGRFGALPG